MIADLIAIFIGSGLGGVCRYLLSKAVQSHVAECGMFPWGTLAVNVSGCLLIGLFYGLFDRFCPEGLISQPLRLFLTVGFCGGFTTFSTFINENFILFQSSNIIMLLGYLALSLLIGFVMLYLGYAITRV